MMPHANDESSVPVILHTRVVTGSGGGPEKTILNSPRWLPELGYRALCAYMHPPGDPGFEQLRQKAVAWQAPLVSIPDRGPWDVGVVFELLELCRREDVAIWHGHDYKSNALGLLLRQFWPMQLVTTVHGWVKQTSRTPLYYAIDRCCLPRYAAVICVSDDIHRECQERGVPAERCHLIENAIDLAEYTRTMTTGQAKQQFGWEPERLLWGAIGRLSEEKGFDVLIRAFDQLLKSGVEADLVIAGDGDQRGRLEALISELGRQGRIRLLGYRADTPLLFQAFDGFVLSSLREGLPNVVLEAMALEVPVVATHIAGIPRLIRDQENGLLIHAGDVAGMAEALRAVSQQPDLRSRLAVAGWETVEANHGFSQRMRKIGNLYDAVLAGARSAGDRKRQTETVTE
jgi:glycosyltransferase involved in cell wall biosynthesis